MFGRRTQGKQHHERAAQRCIPPSGTLTWRFQRLEASGSPRSAAQKAEPSTSFPYSTTGVSPCRARQYSACSSRHTPARHKTAPCAGNPMLQCCTAHLAKRGRYALRDAFAIPNEWNTAELTSMSFGGSTADVPRRRLAKSSASFLYSAVVRFLHRQAHQQLCHLS